MSQPTNILLVDDDETLLASLKRVLGIKRPAWSISTEINPIKALKRIREEQFCVVVADLRMPQMDGIEFLRQVEESSGDSIRILLTGFADTESAMRAVNTGHIFRFLSKPVDFDDLERAIAMGEKQYRLVESERQLRVRLTAARSA